ncbi:MAG: DUF481 domain-containing protein, partial [Sphingobacteriales bacterium]
MRVSLVFISFLLLFCVSQNCRAQILNVERARIENDSSRYYTGSGSLNLLLFNRNAGKDAPNTFIGLTATADIAYLSDRNSYILINNYNYTAVRKEPVIRTGYSHARVNFGRRKRFSSEVFGQYQYDLGRGLNLRTLEAAGLRMKIITGHTASLNTGTGLMHEREEWFIPDSERQILVVNFLKSTNYLSTRIKFNGQTELNAIAYYGYYFIF